MENDKNECCKGTEYQEEPVKDKGCGCDDESSAKIDETEISDCGCKDKSPAGNQDEIEECGCENESTLNNQNASKEVKYVDAVKKIHKSLKKIVDAAAGQEVQNHKKMRVVVVEL